MALPIFQRNVVTDEGDVISGAQVEVRLESNGALATLYSDRAGTVALSNPFYADSSGLAVFYANPDEYKITATGSSGSVTWRYVILEGTAALSDVTTSATDTTAGRLLKVGDFGVNSTLANVYVSTTGNDTTGDGTSGSPFLTVGRAIDWINLRKDDRFHIRLVDSSVEVPIDFGTSTKTLSNKIVVITHTSSNQTYYLNWNGSLTLNNSLLDLYGNTVGRNSGCNIYLNANMLIYCRGKNTVMLGGYYTSNVRFQSNDLALVYQNYNNGLGEVEFVIGYRGNLLVDNAATGCRVNKWATSYVPVRYTRMNTGHSTIAPEIDSTSGVITTAGIYHTGNILGTVSATGTYPNLVPTGAIMESGSNANGQYVKFADGTLICTVQKNYSIATTIAFAGGYISATEYWTYPVVFTANPSVTVQGRGTSRLNWPIHDFAPGTSSFAFRMTAISSQATADHSLVFISIGRWF